MQDLTLDKWKNLKSKIKCPRKKIKKVPQNSANIKLTTTYKESSMGRVKLNINNIPRKAHFTWDERLLLQYYYCGSNGYPKMRSPILLAQILSKSKRTMSRETEKCYFKILNLVSIFKNNLNFIFRINLNSLN